MKNSMSVPNKTYNLDYYRKSKKRRKAIKYILIGILVMIIALLVYSVAEAIVQKAQGDQTDTAKFPVSLTGESPSLLTTTKNELIVDGESKLLGYSTSATKKIDLVHSMSDAVSITVNDRILTYDSGGYFWQISTGNNVEYSQSTDNQILLGRMNENGYFAIVSCEERFYGSLTVYSKDCQQIYKYSEAQNYITDFQFLSNKKGLLIAQTASGTEMQTVLTGLDFTKDEDTKMFTTTLDDTLVYSAKVEKDGSVVLVTDQGIARMDADGTITDTESLTGIIRCINTDRSTVVVAVASEDDINHTDLYEIDSTGKFVHESTIDFIVEDLFCDSTGVVCLGHDYVITLDGTLKLTGTYLNNGSYTQVVRLKGKLFGMSTEELGVISKESNADLVENSASESSLESQSLISSTSSESMEESSNMESDSSSEDFSENSTIESSDTEEQTEE